MHKNIRHATAHSIIILACIFYAREAHVSQIHYHEITLEHMIQSAQGIYIAEPSSPFTRIDKIDIRPITKKLMPGSEDTYPPYARVTYLLKIQKTLHGKKMAGDVEVREANSSDKQYIHKKYYLEGISKSPIYFLYPDGLHDPEKHKSIILIVQFIEDDILELACENGFVDISKEKEVMSILKKLKRS